MTSKEIALFQYSIPSFAMLKFANEVDTWAYKDC